MPGCGASGVWRSSTPDRRSFGVCGRGPLPTGCVCGGCGRGDPSPTPQRAPLRAGFARCGSGTRSPWRGRLLPGCGASGVRRSPTPGRLSYGACGRGPLPTGCGCGVWAWGPGCPWLLLLCRGSSCVVRAFRVCGSRWPLWLGICTRAVVVAGGVPLWRASWPRVGAPRHVRSGRSRCSGERFCRCGAFSHPGGCRPRLYWAAARGTLRPANNWAHCACRWPLPRQGRWARSASYPFGAPRWGCPRGVSPASVLGCVRFPVPSIFPRGTQPAHWSCFVWKPTPPFLGWRTPHPGPAPVCVRSLLGRVGRAGLPGALWCASPFLWPFCSSSLIGPLRAGVARAFFSFFLFGLFFLFLPSSPLAPPLSPAFCASQPGVPWALPLRVRS